MVPPITTEDEQKAPEPTETLLFSPSPPEQPDAEASATMEDALRNLRLRRFTYEMTPWPGEERAESASGAGHAPDDKLPADRGDEEQVGSAPASNGSETAETIAGTIADAGVETEEPESPLGVPFQRQDWSNYAAVEAEEPESPPAIESADFAPARLPADVEIFPPTDEDSEDGAASVTEARGFAPADLSEDSSFEVSSEVSSPNESPIAFAAESPAPEDFSAGVIPSGDDEPEDFSVNTVEAARAKQTKVADEAAQQTGLLLEQVANAAVEQIRHLLGQIATSAIQQSNRAMVRMAEDAADQTGRVLERLAAEATSQVHQILKKIGDEQITPPLSASVEGLGDEVRRVGRELFKSSRSADRNRDLFDSAITELQRLTSRIEQVPSQLYGAESINEVKAAICREMIGVADAMEASLITAQEVLSKLQESAESREVEEEIEVGAVEEEPAVEEAEEPVKGWEDAGLSGDSEAREESVKEEAAGEAPVREDSVEEDSVREAPIGELAENSSDATGDSTAQAIVAPPKPFWSLNSWQDRLRDWLWRVLPPPTPPPGDESNRIAELEERLGQSWEAMNQWLDGQQLLYDRLQTTLQAVGVRPIETEGQMFDLALHRAVSTEARDDVPAGTVVGEERKGYTLDGKILRYAEVIVAKNE